MATSNILASPSVSDRAASGKAPKLASFVVVFFAVAVPVGVWTCLSTDTVLTPSAVVAVYGALVLVTCLIDSETPPPPSLLDSPYFLGFLLTLATLYHGLQTLGLSVAEGMGAEHFLATAAVSLVPTGIGLFLRQLLSLVGDGRVVRDDVNMGKQLAAGVVSIDVTLHALLIATQESLTRDERLLEQAVGKLVEQIEAVRADVLINDIKEAHREMVKCLDGFVAARKESAKAEADAQTNWRETIAAVRRELDRLSSAADSGVDQIKDLIGEFDDQARSMVDDIVDVDSQLAEQRRSLIKQLADIETTTNALATAVSNHGEMVGKATGQADTIVKAAEIALGKLEVATKALVDSATAIGPIPASLGDTARGIESAAVSLDAAVRKAIDPLHRDAKEVNAILNDLVDILSRRVANLKTIQ